MPVPESGRSRIRCPPCAKARQRRQIAENGRQRQQEYENVERRCRDCGARVVRDVVNGPYPTRCLSCRVEAKRARNRAQTARRRKGRAQARPAPVCVDCSTPIPAGSKRCKACVPLEKIRHEKAYWAEHRGDHYACKACGVETPWVGGSHPTRCEPCRGSVRRRQVQLKDLRRRARYAGVNLKKLSFTLFERDGWICYLCELPIDPGLRYPAPGSASLDHVIPISRNGAHSPENVRTAHLICNLRKGTQLLEHLRGNTVVKN
jgi:5-methylcytosine-specific restriction endonuclease McrA